MLRDDICFNAGVHTEIGQLGSVEKPRLPSFIPGRGTHDDS
jgi:hypothetical protein